jgi:hydroxypyruvate reductase
MPDALPKLADHAQQIYHAAVRSVQADRLLTGFDLDEHLPQPIAAYRRVVVLGAGKASMAMAGAVEASGVPVDAGLVVVPHGYAETLPSSQARPEIIEVAEGGHPVPDAAGVAAAGRVLALAEDATADDLVLVLLSGGGSALWPAFAEGITLDDAQATFRLLLRSGADIHAVNTVRKHLSRIGGGRLAVAAHPATVLALVVSDVVGDDLDVIASGPTVPDPTTFAEARDVLARFGLWDAVPASVRERLSGSDEETPKPGDARFERVTTRLLGTNRTALEAARAAAGDRGYAARIVSDAVTGEAREVARALVEQALTLDVDGPACLLWGGETTVTVTGEGTGGRNQELALSAALALDGAGCDVVLLSGGTDGIDGPTDAAGAWATPRTAARARQQGLDPQAFLADNDAHPFFERLDQLLRPGPTHTNVMDVQVALIRG